MTPTSAVGPWITENWWWFWGIAGGIAYITYKVHKRGGNESLHTRILYVFVPALDPKSERRDQLTPRALLLLGIGLLILLAAMFLVPGFSR